ncbi:ParA family protein [Geoalkalibacter sp.]|uniref:ParA family protein n=1 Tax=Geoalkalibacter sp. TaxID=3041440 RepID=UPI00272DFE55|nr:ParA family protein [Geoalkalibacter sp.]
MRAGGAPFVVTVASEKGGVGKTTIATNLAVYLKALREDLPVTIASFDNHFSVDAMFAIGGRGGHPVSSLLGSDVAARVTLGEYGVGFFASERRLIAPNDDTASLRAALEVSRLGGVLILDTRPILDYFTRSALVAADLVLAPVKDRASLVNVAALQRALRDEGGDEAALWLLPSLVDGRLRLAEGVGVQEFLEFAARERGYQIAPTALAKSPKVEGLALGSARRVFPVLTHARGTQVHRQLRDLAEFVLQRFDAQPPPGRRRSWAQASGGPGRVRRRRLAAGCPLCGEMPAEGTGWFCEDTARRRQSLVHTDCLASLVGGAEPSLSDPGTALLVLEKPEPGWHEGMSVALFGYDASGRPAEGLAQANLSSAHAWDLLRALTGRLPEELPATRVFLAPGGTDARDCPAAGGYGRFAALRRKVLRPWRHDDQRATSREDGE